MPYQVRKNTSVPVHVHPADYVDEYSDTTTLDDDDFVVRIWYEGTEDGSLPATLNFVQIGTSGEYRATVTFAETGFWVLEVRIADPYTQIYREEYEVVEVTSSSILRGRAI